VTPLVTQAANVSIGFSWIMAPAVSSNGAILNALGANVHQLNRDVCGCQANVDVGNTSQLDRFKG